MFKKIIRSFLFLVFSQGSWLVGSVYFNPFLENKDHQIAYIDDLILTSRQAGYTKQPKTIDLYFNLFNKNREKVYQTDLKEISVNLTRGQQKYFVPLTLKWENNRYQAELFLPQVEKSGWYDLEIMVGKTKKIFKQEKKALNYLASGFNLIFLIDNSYSMLANDPNKIRYKAIAQIVKNQQFKNKINTIGVVGFSSKAKALVQPTSLEEFLKKNWIANIKPDGDTNFAAGLKEVNRLLDKLPKGESNLVIFLSDGQTNYPYNDEHKLLLKNNATIFSVGFKNKRGEFKTDLLKKIAAEGNGIYQAGEALSIEKIYLAIIEESLSLAREMVVYPMKQNYYKNELLLVNYETALKGIRYQVKINQKKIPHYTLENEKVFFLLSPAGGQVGEVAEAGEVGELYDLEVIFFQGQKKLKKILTTVSVKNQLAPIEIDFPLIIGYKKNVTDQVSFFSFKSESDFFYLDFALASFEGNFLVFDENFTFLESPLSVEKNQWEKMSLSFDGSFLETKKSDLLILKTSAGFFLYEANFIPWEDKKFLQKEISSSKSNSFLALLLALSGIFLVGLCLKIRREE